MAVTVKPGDKPIIAKFGDRLIEIPNELFLKDSRSGAWIEMDMRGENLINVFVPDSIGSLHWFKVTKMIREVKGNRYLLERGYDHWENIVEGSDGKFDPLFEGVLLRVIVILLNGKLIAIPNEVFLQDPTRGYWMWYDTVTNGYIPVFRPDIATSIWYKLYLKTAQLNGFDQSATEPNGYCVWGDIETTFPEYLRFPDHSWFTNGVEMKYVKSNWEPTHRMLKPKPEDDVRPVHIVKFERMPREAPDSDWHALQKSKLERYVEENYDDEWTVIHYRNIVIHRSDPGRSPFERSAPLFHYYLKKGVDGAELSQRCAEQENLYARLLRGISECTDIRSATGKLFGLWRYLKYEVENSGQLSEEKKKDMLRDLVWARLSVTMWISKNMQYAPKHKTPHVTDSVMYDLVVGGVAWNPVQFRRYLPKQLIVKAQYAKECRDLLRIMNTPAVVNTKYPDHFLEYRETSFLSPEQVEAKGYPEEAAFMRSLTDNPIARMALVYWERSVLLTNYKFVVRNVTRTLDDINERVRNLSPEDMIQAFLKIAEFDPKESYDTYESVLF